MKRRGVFTYSYDNMKKKWFLWVFAVLTALLLVSCGKKEGGNDSSTEPTESTYAPIGRYAVISVRSTPDFDFVIDSDHCITNVNANNEAAETLMKGKNMYGKTFDEGFRELLTDAVEKEVIIDGDNITITLEQATQQFLEESENGVLENAEMTALEIVTAKNLNVAVDVVRDVYEIIEDEVYNPEDDIPQVCTKCNGSGYAICSSCGGSGNPKIKPGEKAESEGTPSEGPDVCEECEGTGGYCCPDCNGTGFLEN